MNHEIADKMTRLPFRQTQPVDARAATHDFLVLNPHPDLTQQAGPARRGPVPKGADRIRWRGLP